MFRVGRDVLLAVRSLQGRKSDILTCICAEGGVCGPAGCGTDNGGLCHQLGIPHGVVLGEDFLINQLVCIGLVHCFNAGLVAVGNRDILGLSVFDGHVIGVVGTDRGPEGQAVEHDRVCIASAIGDFIRGVSVAVCILVPKGLQAFHILIVGRGNRQTEIVQPGLVDEHLVCNDGTAGLLCGQAVDMAVRRGGQGLHRGVGIQDLAEIRHIVLDIVIQRDERAEIRHDVGFREADGTHEGVRQIATGHQHRFLVSPVGVQDGIPFD